MRTGKLIINPNPTYHSSNDENSYIPVTSSENIENNGGKLRALVKSSTCLRELSLMNNNYFGAKHYDIHLDMKVDYTTSRIFKERQYRNQKHIITYVSSNELKFYN